MQFAAFFLPHPLFHHRSCGIQYFLHLIPKRPLDDGFVLAGESLIPQGYKSPVQDISEHPVNGLGRPFRLAADLAWLLSHHFAHRL